MILSWVDLPKPLIGLSPMADLTDLPYSILIREVSELMYKRLGLEPEILGETKFFGPILFREMVSANAIVMQNDKTLDMIKLDNVEYPVIQQIVGNDPVMITDAAQIIIERSNPSGIDINMGCPSKKINKNGSGAALLNNMPLAKSIIKEYKSRIKDVPLSVKIRVGWDTTTDIVNFTKELESSGIDLLSVHGRTRSQGYSGKSNNKIIGKIKKNLNIPVLGNGDVLDIDSGLFLMEETQCDGILIGRGSLGNPWVFASIIYALKTGNRYTYEVSLNERIDVVLRHLELHVNHYGSNGYVTFKKHLVFYFKNIDLRNSKKIRVKLVKSNSASEIKEILNTLKN